jgi:hypothetical protein
MKTTHFASIPVLAMSALALGLVLLLGGSGCASLAKPNSASFASVTITNHAGQEIVQATISVFTADGYQYNPTGGDQLLFDREASRGTTLAREGILGTYYGAQTFIRVRVQVVPLFENIYRLQCRAYVIGTGADEVPLADARRGPFQDLLNKVKAQLN